MLWEIDLHSRCRRNPDRAAARVATAARELGLGGRAACGRGRVAFLVQGKSLDRGQVQRLANELLADLVVEAPIFGRGFVMGALYQSPRAAREW